MVRRCFTVLLAPALATAFTAGLAACTAANGASGKLANSAWLVTSVDGSAALSANARLAFAGTRLSATAGCNTMAGTWRAEQGRLFAGQLVSTQMYCAAPGLMDQERGLATLLSGAPEFDVDGDVLHLRSGGHAAQLRRER